MSPKTRLSQASLSLWLILAGCQATGAPGVTLANGQPDQGEPTVAPANIAPVNDPRPIPTLAKTVPAPLPATAPAVPVYEMDSVLVSLAPGISTADFLALAPAKGLTVLANLAFTGHGVLLVGLASNDTPENVRRRLAGAPGVQAVYFNMKASPHFAPNDEDYDQQWSHRPEFANTEGAWDRIKAENIDASNVIIGDIDTGVDSDHIEFKGRMVAGRNPTAYGLVASHKDPPDFTGDNFGHGTFTAGIAAAEGNNGQAIAGVAWKAKIMPIKVDHPEKRAFNDPRLTWGKFDLGDIIAGIKYACDNNDVAGAKVRVLNMSLGQDSTGIEPLYVEAVAYARRRGILVVASTGNNGSDVIPPPANTPGVIAVGATSHYLKTEFLSPDSNYGARLDLVAPGGGILSTVPILSQSSLGSRTSDNSGLLDFRGVAFASGTSEAAPYVTGVAALVFAKYDPKNASLSSPDEAAKMVDRVRAHLLKSVDDLGPPGWDPAFGAGRINADKALADPLPLPDGPPPTF